MKLQHKIEFWIKGIRYGILNSIRAFKSLTRTNASSWIIFSYLDNKYELHDFSFSKKEEWIRCKSFYASEGLPIKVMYCPVTEVYWTVREFNEGKLSKHYSKRRDAMIDAIETVTNLISEE